jgi:hypothetical protein
MTKYPEYRKGLQPFFCGSCRKRVGWAGCHYPVEQMSFWCEDCAKNPLGIDI